jgi:oligosaccharide translocation protein RFT1
VVFTLLDFATLLNSCPHHRSAPDSSILKLAYALTKQSFFKQVLTEGDKVIVSRISPIEDQGGYALALNYGELPTSLTRPVWVAITNAMPQ